MKTSFAALVCSAILTIGAAASLSAAEHPRSSREVVLEYNRLMNAGKWQDALELFSDDTAHHGGSSQDSVQRTVTGREQRRQVLEDIFTTFPDWRMDIIEIIAERDLVVMRANVTGTHLGIQRMNVNGGTLIGVPPTGKRFKVLHTHWYRVRDGRIIEHWANRDDLGMTRQLGLLPPAPK
jgi:steroid delta-isomerase-like uncharacterized protein